MEGSRLDFGGPGARFWRLRAQFFQDFRMFLAECAENLPRTCRGLAELVDAYLRSLRFCGLAPLGRDLLRGGGAAVVPPRGFQSAGHRRCANGVPDSFPTGSVQSQLANLDILSSSSFAQFDLKCSFPYPFLSPGAWGPPQTRRQKAEKFGFFAFLVDFFAFRTALEK